MRPTLALTRNAHQHGPPARHLQWPSPSICARPRPNSSSNPDALIDTHSRPRLDVVAATLPFFDIPFQPPALTTCTHSPWLHPRPESGHSALPVPPASAPALVHHVPSPAPTCTMRMLGLIHAHWGTETRTHPVPAERVPHSCGHTDPSTLALSPPPHPGLQPFSLGSIRAR